MKRLLRRRKRRSIYDVLDSASPGARPGKTDALPPFGLGYTPTRAQQTGARPKRRGFK